eukprot:GHVN01037716.1.p1 GENE.GHVN01037716.1~~GHVN01037716.1.p1  ORF type:complete len:311 (+),score=15.11 GHVN01037716.1:89-1021(+)
MKKLIVFCILLGLVVAEDVKKPEKFFKKGKKLIGGLYFLDALYGEQLGIDAVGQLQVLETLIRDELFTIGYDRALIDNELISYGLDLARNKYDPTERPTYRPTTTRPHTTEPYTHAHERTRNTYPHDGTPSPYYKRGEEYESSYSSSEKSGYSKGSRSKGGHQYIPENPCISSKTNYYVTEELIKGYYPDEICRSAQKKYLPELPEAIEECDPPSCTPHCEYKGSLIITDGFYGGSYLMPFNADLAVVFGGKKCANVFFKPRAGYRVFAPDGGDRYGCNGPRGDRVQSVVLCDCKCGIVFEDMFGGSCAA